MSFQIEVGGDFSELLAGFKQLEQRAQQSGDAVGKGLADGIKGYSSQSIAALQAELNRLQSRQTRVAIDSTAFDKAGQRIQAIQSLLSEVEKRKLLIGVDDRSITALQTKLAALQSKQTKVSVDSREFLDLQREIDKLEGELDAISRRKLLINADGNSVLALTAKLRGEIDTLQQRQIRLNVDSQEFADTGREIARLEGELQALERKRTEVTIDSRSLTALQGRLAELQQRQTKVSVDGTEFTTLQRQIDTVQQEISDVQRRRVLINADPSSIIALNSKISGLRDELEKVAIGSQRFKELQGQISKTEGEIARASQTAAGLRGILSKDIGGGLFGQLAGLASLGGVVAFFKAAIDEAVKLETITRKLSNTLGSQGAAGALTFTRKLSDELGLSFNTLSNTFGGFTAAATAAGVPIQKQKDLFAAVSKSAQSLGLSNDELSGSLLALQQVASKGTVQMEELRGQLGERLPVAFGATAKGLGLTQQELIKLVESGKLTADRFFGGLTKGLNELNNSAGGVPTAAQNFAKLGNAWTDLQASLGTSLLPTVTGTVKQLALALEGLKVEAAAKDLRQSFGLTADQATQLVGSIKAVQEQYGLTNQQAKNLLSNAIANTGASRDWFGELNLGGKQFSQVQLNLIDLAKQYRAANPDLAAQKREEAIATQKVLEAQRKALDLENARKASAVELARVYTEAQVKGLQGQLELGQQLVGLSRAVGDVEQSRFNVTRSALQFELQKLEERGAGEAAIGAKKAEIDRVDQAALSAKYRALQQQQQLELALLDLSQQKARIEAQSAVDDLRTKRAQAEVELARATNEVQKEGLRTAIAAIDVQIDGSQKRITLLDKIQPIERAIAAAQGETARNGLQAEAAAKGFRVAADGSLVKAQGLASTMERVTTLSGASADQQARFQRTAEQAGLAVGRAADGSLVLGRNQQDVTRAVQGTNAELSRVKGGYDSTAKAAGGAKGQTDQLRQALFGAGLEADDLSGTFDLGKAGLKESQKQTNLLKEALWRANDPAGGIADAFTSTGRNAPAAAQGARDFAAWLSQAKVFVEKIDQLNLSGKMEAVSNATRGAAEQAEKFYGWLQKAAALPGSRWTGGPVEAGAEYRVNELGQEALLSAGRLSLINAPANSVWRAPSNGVVVPAGITARLQETGALPVAGSVATQQGVVAAQQAVVLSKLEKAIDRLADRQWNINVTQRTGPTGSQVLKTLQQLR